MANDVTASIIDEAFDKAYKDILKGNTSNKPPALTISTGSITGASGAWTTANAGQSWTNNDMMDQHKKRVAAFKQTNNKCVVDIGIDANVTTITFDDYSMLYLVPVYESFEIKELTELSMLNGTRLSDIVIVRECSLVTNRIAVIKISNEYGVNMLLEVHDSASDRVTNPFDFFNMIYKEANAVRKQTQTV